MARGRAFVGAPPKLYLHNNNNNNNNNNNKTRYLFRTHRRRHAPRRTIIAIGFTPHLFAAAPAPRAFEANAFQGQLCNIGGVFGEHDDEVSNAVGEISHAEHHLDSVDGRNEGTGCDTWGRRGCNFCFVYYACIVAPALSLFEPGNSDPGSHSRHHPPLSTTVTFTTVSDGAAMAKLWRVGHAAIAVYCCCLCYHQNTTSTATPLHQIPCPIPFHSTPYHQTLAPIPHPVLNPQLIPSSSPLSLLLHSIPPHATQTTCTPIAGQQPPATPPPNTGTYPPTHPPTHSLIYSVTSHPPTHPLTHPPPHPPTKMPGDRGLFR